MELCLIMIYPLAPHFTEILYNEVVYPHFEDKTGHPEYISHHRFP